MTRLLIYSLHPIECALQFGFYERNPFRVVEVSQKFYDDAAHARTRNTAMASSELSFD